MRVLDAVEIEEACVRNALLEEGLVAIAAVIGQKPRCAEGDDAGRGGDLAVDVFLERGLELCGRDEVRIEGELRGHCAPASDRSEGRGGEGPQRAAEA